MAQQPLYRRGRSTRLLVVALVTASLVTITVDYRGGETGPLASAGRATLSLISPLQKTMSNLLQPVGDFFSTVTNIGALRAENARLEAEMQELLTQQGNALSLQHRVEQLEKLLGFRESLGTIPTLEARVVAEGVSNLEWLVTINAGARDGVTVGMPVVAPDGLVGHVVKAANGVSDVQLILDPNSQVGARLPASDGEIGLLRGQRDQDLRFQLIDPETRVAPGEPVETAGLDLGGDRPSLYPPHIPIGRVSRVQQDPGALSGQVEVEPFVDFTALQYVFVLLTSRP